MPSAVSNDESIYKLIPQPHVSVEKGPMHRSVYADQARYERKVNHAKKRATMGPLKVPKADTQKFLKAHEKDPLAIPKPTTEHKKSEKSRLPLWEPNKPIPEPVKVPTYAPKTKKQPWELEKYTKKPDFGKTPSYLIERQQKEHDLEHLKQAVQDEAKDLDGIRKLTEAERNEILTGLKHNWKELMTEYQKLPLVIDTTPKIQRKLKLEAYLKQIEADIEKFSADVVYVQ